MKFRNRDLASLREGRHIFLRRILFALLLSLIAHVWIIWTPHFRLPQAPIPLPEISVHLNPLPKIADKPRPRKKAAPKVLPEQLATAKAETVKKTATPPLVQPVSTPLNTGTFAASAVPSVAAASAPSAETAIAAASAIPATPDSIPFPSHIELTFAVFKGDNGLRLGEVQHSLDISDNRYIVQSHTRTTGIVSWFKHFNLNQISTGSVLSHGLRPDKFTEEKNNSGDVHLLTTDFDWQTHQIHFSSGNSAELPDNAQDALSILYQLSLTRMDQEGVIVALSTGKKLETVNLAIANHRLISTSLGELDTVWLHRIQNEGQTGMNIWLSREYRMLPVKIQYLEADGTISATISITRLRYTDD